MVTKIKKKASKKSVTTNPDDIFKVDYHTNEFEPWRIFKIMAELVSGYEFIGQYKKAATIFGSARNGFDKDIYEEATKLSAKLVENKFAVITGGGPGMMEAANKGAFQAKGKSIGLNIKLANGGVTERKNAYLTDSLPFDYFFVRKVMLSFSSRVYIYFPGGYGTFDELFELLTLIETGKIKSVPVVLVNKEFWGPMVEWVRSTVYLKNKAIDKKDFDMLHLADNADEAIKLIKKLVK